MEQTVNPGTEARAEGAATLTQADLDRVVQQTIARERRRAEAALEAARAEAGRAERERLEAGMAQRERDVARRELAAHAREALAARGLPGELAGVLDYSGQEALDASLDSAERAFRAAVQRGMEQRLPRRAAPHRHLRPRRGLSGPRARGGGAGEMTEGRRGHEGRGGAARVRRACGARAAVVRLCGRARVARVSSPSSPDEAVAPRLAYILG